VEEWLAHGGPSDQNASRARRILEDFLEGDTLGLEVRREAGVLHFTYEAATFLLRRNAPTPALGA